MALTGTGTIADNNPLVLVTCANRDCGMEYMIPRAYHAKLRQHGVKVSTHCPAGHSWYYNESELDRANKKIATLEGDLAATRERRDDHFRDLEHAKRTAAYWKGRAHRKAGR